MHISFGIFDFIVLFGIVQGFITSILLLISGKKKYSNRFLALGLMSFCILSFKILMHSMHLWDISYMRYFPLSIDLAIPPLVYFYAISLIEAPKSSNTTYIYAFLPFIIFMIYSIYVYIQVFPIENNVTKDQIATHLLFSSVKRAEDYFTHILIFMYLFFGYKKLKFYKQQYTYQNNPHIQWLKRIIHLMILLGVFGLINIVLGFIFPESAFFRWKIYYIYLAGVIYFIGFKGYKHSLLHPKAPTKIKKTNEYKNETYSVFQSICNVVEKEKIYLDPKANIHVVAKHLKRNSRDLTPIFQCHSNITFKEYLNQKRIEEVINKLNDTSTNHLTILGIALNSGFNSEASFYRVFKLFMGCTPKTYLQRQKNASK